MFSAELTLNPPSRRRAGRTPVDAPAAIASEERHRSICRIGDISASGARLTLFDPISPRAELALRLPGGIERRARIVWMDDLEIGCAFDEPLEQETVDALADRFGVDGRLSNLFRNGHA